jgi:hypothetical protein
MADGLEQDLEGQLKMTHQRFVAAMNARVPEMPLEQKERYFAVLSTLVAKLEDQGKPLREILQEMMAEAAAYVFQEMQSDR